MTALPDWMRPPRAEGCSRRTWTTSPRFGPAHAGSSAGDLGVIDLKDVEGWVVTGHHNDVLTYVGPGEPQDQS